MVEMAESINLVQKAAKKAAEVNAKEAKKAEEAAKKK
jgi:hypothetical protein